MKKFLLRCISIMVIISLISGVAVFAKESGSFGGTDIEWILDDDGIFTVWGKGAIPASVWGQSKSKIKQVIIEEGITSIPDSAFDGCYNLTTVQLPESLVSIGNYAFQNCRTLENLALPGNIETIGNAAFYNCISLKEVILPKSLKEIGTSVFNSCTSLTDVIISDGITQLSGSLFSGCSSLKNITIPESVTVIGDSTFNKCNILEEIELPEALEEIGIGAFSGCSSLNEINIPESVSNIGNRAFYNCESLEKIVIPYKIKSIPTNLFYNCYSLSSVNIPSGVINIGENAFTGCENLGTVYYAGTQSEWEKIIFSEGNEALNSAQKVYDIPSVKGVKFAPIVDSKVELEIALSGYNNGGKLMGVMYGDGAVKSVQSADVKDETKLSFKNAEYGNEYKILWWNGIDKMNPVANSFAGEIEEYIPEFKYGYLTDIKSEESAVVMCLYTEYDEFLYLNIAPEFMINDKEYSSVNNEVYGILKESAQMANSNYPNAGNVFYHQPILYSTNYKGEIDVIHTVLSNTEEDISAVLTNENGDTYFAPANERTYKSSAKTFTDFKVSSNTKIIFVPDDRSDNERYRAFKYTTAFGNARKYWVEAYGITSSGTASLVLMYNQNDEEIYTYRSPWMVVSSIEEVNGETMIEGYSASPKTVSVSANMAKPVSGIEVGDVIRYLIDKNKEMVDYQIWFDMSNPVQEEPCIDIDSAIDSRILEIHTSSTEPRKNYPMAAFRLQYGTVAEYEYDTVEQANVMTVSPVIEKDGMEMVYEGDGVITKSLGSIVKAFYYDNTGGEPMVKKADLSNISDYKRYGENAAKVVVYSASGTVRMVYFISGGREESEDVPEKPEEEDVEEQGVYGYLCSVEDAPEDSIYNKEFKFFDTKGNFYQASVAEIVEIDGRFYYSSDPTILDLLKRSAIKANENYPEAQNVTYHQPVIYFQKDGVITKVHTVLNTEDDDISAVMNTDEDTFFVPAGERKYKSSSKSFTDFKVSSGTKIMFIPDDREAYDDYITFSSYAKAFNNYRDYLVEGYGLTSTGTAAFILIYKENDSMIYTASSPLMIVQSVAKTTEGDYIIGYTGTSYTLKSVFVNEKKCRSVDAIEKGDVIRYLVDGKGYMTDYQIWFDMSNPCQLQPVSRSNDLFDDGDATTEGSNRIIEIHSTSVTPRKNYPTATFRLQYGTVTELVLNNGDKNAIDEEFITISPVLVEDGLEMDYFANERNDQSSISKTINSSLEVFSFDRGDENAEVISEASLSDILPYYTYGDEATRVIAYTASGTLRMIYIIKD